MMRNNEDANTAEKILLWWRRVPQQCCKPGASVQGEGWWTAGPDPGWLKQEMDLLTGICVAGRAAGNAGEPAPEKRKNRVEMGSKKFSQYREHRSCEGITATDAEHWMLRLVLLALMPLLHLETMHRCCHQSHQDGFSSLSASLCH